MVASMEAYPHVMTKKSSIPKNFANHAAGIVTAFMTCALRDSPIAK
jgi:hypothetical protein